MEFDHHRVFGHRVFGHRVFGHRVFGYRVFGYRRSAASTLRRGAPGPAARVRQPHV